MARIRHTPARTWPPSVLRIALPVLLAVLPVALSRPAAAQLTGSTQEVTKRGTTASEFLSIPVGARATAMGNAFTATVDDPTAIYWNPAGLASMTQGGFSAEIAQWLADIDFNFVSLVFPTRAGTFGVGVTSMRTPDMEVTTVDEQNGTGETFDAGSLAFALSYGRALTDRFSLGITAKYINERIWHSTSSGFALDIGTMFVTPFYGIRLGAAITNFGTKMSINGDDLLIRVDVDPNNSGNNESNRALLRTDAYDLPLTMRIGVAGEVVQNDAGRLTLAVEALNPNNSDQYVNAGAEIGLLGDLILFRGGYSELFLDDSIRSFTAGAGLRYRFGTLNFAFDYAYERQEYFTDINRFSFALQF